MSDSAKTVTVSQGKKKLNALIPQLNQEMEVVLPLSSRGGGELHLRAMIVVGVTSLDDLKAKCEEVMGLRALCATYEQQLNELDRINAENTAIAQKNIDKLTKKCQLANDKYNELQEKLMAMSVDVEKAQTELIGKKDPGLLQQTTEALNARIATLSSENESLRFALRKEKEDKDILRVELDELYHSNQEDLKALQEKISSVNEENRRLQHEHLQQIKTIQDLHRALEQSKLAASQQSSPIVYSATLVENSSIVSNSFLETLISSTSVTQNYLTQVLKSADLETLKREFVAQLTRCDLLTRRHSRLLDRLQQLSHPILVGVRTRPPSEEELKKSRLIVENAGQGSSEVGYWDRTRDGSGSGDWFVQPTDFCWGYDRTQEEVFEDIEPLLAALIPSAEVLIEGNGLKGNDVALLGYGGKKSGKTFTLFGYGNQPGLTYRLVQRIFDLTDFHKTQLGQMQRQPNRLGPGQEVINGELEHTVTLTAVEVIGTVVRDLLASGEAHPPLSPRYDSATKQATLQGVTRVAVASLTDFANVISGALKSRGLDGASSLVLDITIETKCGEQTKSTHLWIADLVACDENPADSNLTSLVNTLLYLGKGSDPAPSQSPLVTLLQPAFLPHARIMLLCNLGPSELTLEPTRQTLQLVQKMRAINRPAHLDDNNALDSKLLALKMHVATHDQREAKARSLLVDQTLSQTKQSAEELIRKVQASNTLLLNHYEEEKATTRQLNLDLELTQRHLKHVLEELREQKKTNDRLLVILKVLEDERQSRLAAAPCGSPTPK